MKSALKIIALLLVTVMLFSSCGSTETHTPEESTTLEAPAVSAESTPKGDGKIALPYNKTDGLNPYFAKSNENLYICQLLYDSLFTVDKEYNLVNKIATGVTVNGKTATVQLRSDAVCRGTQPINAYDVVYSFNLAKASYGWSGYLKGVTEAVVKSTYSVAFTLETEDVHIGAKLCFPIVKEGTADIENAIPTGSGEYYCLEEKLVRVSDDSTISLYNVGTNKSAENAFKIGATDIYFNDLSNSEYVGINGVTDEVPLNNMVYLGLNSKNGGLNKYVRSAIAAQINSEDIVISSYEGHGRAVKVPVNPDVDYYESIETVEATGDSDLAVKILDRSGFTRYSGKAKTNGAYLLSFKLIVNRNNKYRLAAAYNIADSLNRVGIYVTVQPLSFADYKQRIAAGNYDMYIGEVKLDGSMDLSVLLSGELGAGVDKESRSVKEYAKFRAGKLTYEEYYSIFIEEYPFVPILFRNGYVVTSADIKTNVLENPFYLYENIG